MYVKYKESQYSSIYTLTTAFKIKDFADMPLKSPYGSSASYFFLPFSQLDISMNLGFIIPLPFFIL